MKDTEAKGGLTNGKSHEEGGIPLVVKSTGQKIEVEGGEGIVNKRNMSSTETKSFEGKEMTNCEIISAINQENGNGVKFNCDEIEGRTFLREGGMLNQELSNQPSLFKESTNDFHTLNIFENSKEEVFREGGFLNKNQSNFSLREVSNWDEVPVRWKNTSKVNKVSYKVDPIDKGLNNLMSKIVGNDPFRPVFSGINFDDNGATSTDAHKLLSIPAETEFRGVYPTLSMVKKGSYTLNDGKIDIKYPDYSAVIPKEFSFIYKANLYKLLQYCKAALNYANKTTYQIGLRVNEEMNIGLNAKLTIDIVSSFIAMGYDNAYFHFINPSRPIVVSNDENPTLGKSIIGLIMPLMITNKGIGDLGTADLDFSLYLKPYFDFEKNEIINYDGSIVDFKMNYGEDDVFTKEIIDVIKSIVSNKTNVVILENFIIKNKTIIVNNLDDSIEIKNIDVPDGVYSIENDVVIQSYLDRDYISEYPSIASIDDSESIYIDKSFFLWAIDKTKNGVGNDNLRPVMTGINIQKKNNLLSITSTNGHLLTTIESNNYIKLNSVVNDFSLTITPKNISKSIKLMDSDQVEIAFIKDRYSDGALKGSTTVKFICDDIIYTTLSIEGKYPNYRAIIPYGNPKSLLVNMRDIKSIVSSKEAKDFMVRNKKGSDIIKVYGVELGGNMNIHLQSSKGGYNKTYEIIEDKFLGKIGYDYDYETINGNTCSLIMPVIKNEGFDGNVFTFNASLFNDFLDNLDGEILEIGFSEPNRAYIVGERNLFYTDPKIKVKSKPKSVEIKEEVIKEEEVIVENDTSIKDLIEALEILEETELVEALMLLDDEKEIFKEGGEIISSILKNGYVSIQNIKDKELCFITYNSGGQENLTVNDTINSIEACRVLIEMNELCINSARNLIYDHINNCNRIETIEELEYYKKMPFVIILDRDRIETFSNGGLVVQGKNEIREYAENILKEFNPRYGGYSDTNGQSMYFYVGDIDNPIKVRFSDHSVTNRDRMSNEVHFGLSFNREDYKEFLNNQKILEIKYKLGDKSIKFEKISLLMPSGRYLDGFGYVQTFAKGGEMKTSKSMFFEPTKSNEEEEKIIMENQFGKNI